MSLDGTNKMCAQCKGSCKQFSGVKIVQCVSFKPLNERIVNKNDQ